MTDNELESMCHILRLACDDGDFESLDGIRVICKLIKDRNPEIKLERELQKSHVSPSGLLRKESFWIRVNGLCVINWEITLSGSWDRNKKWTVEESNYHDFRFANILIKEFGIEYKVTELEEPSVIHKFLSDQAEDGRFGVFAIGTKMDEPLARYNDFAVANNARQALGEETHFVRELVQEWVKVHNERH